jgi:predicted HTH domain antitoxin
MAKPKPNNDHLKKAVKEAIQELLIEDREFLREVLVEAAEDAALGQAIIEGRKSKRVSRQTVLKILKGRK